MIRRFRLLLLASSALGPLAATGALANPLGGEVVGGQATVQGQGTSSVTVIQSSNRAIVNWKTFNIGAGETTRFLQPNSTSVILNRVTGGLGPSQLHGTLTANGRVFLVNPDGILVGAGGRIDTAGFLATTHDIKNSDFMAGQYLFNIPGRRDASVVNLGTITAQTGGFAALVAPGVRNSGTITANLGTVGLASANRFSLDFYGDRLITLSVGDAIAAQVKDVATGKPLKALVSNDGRLSASGGRVELTAAAARTVVDSVINNRGVIEANSVGTKNGMIVLGAATAATKPAGSPTQSVKVSGTLSAAGKGQDEKGGFVQITGEAVTVADAMIDASGRSGGGIVLIGGDTGGGSVSPTVAGLAKAQLQPLPVPTASMVAVDAASVIDASAKEQGDGGKVVVWSDGSTVFNGAVLATGGSQAGDGGFAEVSGHQSLSFDGAANLGAPAGVAGTLLLDPLNATIALNPGAGIVTVASIQNALATNNVVVTTGTTGSEPGDLTVAAPLFWSTPFALSLSAFRNIAVNANITNTAGAAVNLRADNTGTGAGTVSFGPGILISTSGAVSIFYNPSVNPAGSVVNGTSYVAPIEEFSANVTGGGALMSYMLVNTVFDLHNMRNNLSGIYALGKDVDASSTVSTNFSYIGSSSNPFVGIFDGNGHVIDQLTVVVGLFGYVGTSGIVRNVGITNSNAIANFVINRDLDTGLLVGTNSGLVTNSFSDGTVNASVWGAAGGGLVGWNTGTISDSYSTASVKGSTANAPDGGLVGVNDSTGIITRSYATGSVLSSAGDFYPVWVGGLIGWNRGFVTQSYATGSVTGTFQGHAGGFVAVNDGTISQSYSSGAVNAPGIRNTVGGFAGSSGNAISQSYSTGYVTAGSISTIGGFLAIRYGGAYAADYWDSQTSGQATSAGGTGLTTAQLKSSLPAGFDPAVWGISASINNGYPHLLWTTAAAPPSPTVLLPGSGGGNEGGGVTTPPFSQPSATSLPAGFAPTATQQTNQLAQNPNSPSQSSTSTANARSIAATNQEIKSAIYTAIHNVINQFGIVGGREGVVLEVYTKALSYFATHKLAGVPLVAAFGSIDDFAVFLGSNIGQAYIQDALKVGLRSSAISVAADTFAEYVRIQQGGETPTWVLARTIMDIAKIGYAYKTGGIVGANIVAAEQTVARIIRVGSEMRSVYTSGLLGDLSSQEEAAFERANAFLVALKTNQYNGKPISDRFRSYMIEYINDFGDEIAVLQSAKNSPMRQLSTIIGGYIDRSLRYIGF